MITATKIELVCKVNVRKAPKRGKTPVVTDCGIFLGDQMVAFRTFNGEATGRYCMAQFRRTGGTSLWRRDPLGWDMYQSFKSVL